MNDKTHKVLEFISGFKNSESLDKEVRDAISVQTELDRALVERVKLGGPIFLTGTAGSGKTHLVETVTPHLNEIAEVVYEPRTRGSHVLVIGDATELSVEQRLDALDSPPKSRRATVIAINEGPLREVATSHPESQYAKALDLLRHARTGGTRDWDPALPTVIDMGSFDPIQSHVLEDILGLDVLTDCVALVSSDEPSTVRLDAWRQLQSSEVRRRISNLVTLVELASEGWMFRDLWDLIADLVTGGQSDHLPTSTWFWRLFNGTSKISRCLRSVCTPNYAVLPGLDSRIYFSDWQSIQNELLTDVELIPMSQPDNDDVFEWLKSQVALLAQDANLPGVVLDLDESELQHAVLDRRPEVLVSALNAYMGYGLVPSSKNELALFASHGVERKTARPGGQIRLGVVSVNDLLIRRSNAVVNTPPSVESVPGESHYLCHVPSGARIALTREKLRLIQRGRSFRMRDRAYTDLDHDLFAFFSQIVRHQNSSNASSQRLGVCLFEFTQLTSDKYLYVVSEDPALVEEVAGW